jgi:hypothetical protein
MSEETISVRIPRDKKAALDAIAAQSERDLSVVVEEALSAYLELHAWQLEHVKKACGRPMRASSRRKPRCVRRSPDGGADDQVDQTGDRRRRQHLRLHRGQ